MTRARLRIATAVALALIADPVCAHEIIPGVTGFPGGLLHPVLIPAHLMTLVGLALLIGRGKMRLISELVFAAALIGGLGAIALGTGETRAPLVLLAVAAICGLLIAAALPAPRPVVWLLAAVVGVAIGLDSPPDVISIRMAYVIMLGTWIGAVAVLVALAEVAARLARHWQLIGLRVLSSWIAASAILVLALRLAR
jgi:hydrogenase/urease accessory protein HupE